MKGGNYSKFTQPFGFSLANKENSLITYRNYHLYYEKFKEETFATLIEQYERMSGQQLVLSINGLVLDCNLKIQEIIQTPQEERAFEYLLNHQKGEPLIIPQQYRQQFNQIIFRIINSKQYFEQPISLKKPAVKNEKTQKKEQIHELECPSLIYWIDDEPANNTEIIEKYFKIKGLMIIQVTSTMDMVNILKKELPVHQKNGTKILFISDMSRKEEKGMNYTAGIDIFEHIYHKLKLTFNGIAFVNNIEATEANMIKRHLKRDHIEIINKENSLVETIYAYFSIVHH